MPTLPSITPVCEGFLIDVGPPGASPAQRLALAKRVVRGTLSGSWRVEPLGKHSSFFEVTRRARAKTVALSTAWNLVHALKADRDVRSAEPALTLQGIEPHPAHRREQLTRKESARAKSSGGETHKPGSRNPDWSIRSAGIDRAWKLEPVRGKRFGDGIVVGHPDTGYTLHPEIWNNPGGWQRVRWQAGYDFVDNKPHPVDPLVDPHPSHGTKTASVIMSDAGAGPGASQWVSGAAPRALLVPYRVIKSVVVFNFASVAKAIFRAVDGGCHVISMSLGGPLHSQALADAVRYAAARDVIVLAAAGNVWPFVVYPAKLEQVIAVAATHCDDGPWKQSAHGDAVDVCAPGESVWRAETRSAPVPYALGRGTGTSFAVATAAGVTALWLAYHGRDRLVRRFGAGNLASAYRELLVTHGVRRPAGWDTDDYGAGIIDAEKLLRARLPDNAPAADTSAGPKRRARRARAGVVADIADFFPGTSPARVRAALAAELHARDDELDSLLAEMGDEVAFHIATDAAFREALQERAAAVAPRPSRRGAKGRTGARVRRAPRRRNQVARRASRALKKRMGL
jgi:thermitase